MKQHFVKKTQLRRMFETDVRDGCSRRMFETDVRNDSPLFSAQKTNRTMTFYMKDTKVIWDFVNDDKALALCKVVCADIVASGRGPTDRRGDENVVPLDLIT